MLTREQQQGIRERLERERTDLQARIEASQADVAAMGQYEDGEQATLGNHPADGGTELYEQEQRLTVEQASREILMQVEHALERLNTGAYGVCEICGEPIAPERLEALPYTTLCIRCQAEQERSGPTPL